MPTAKPRRPRGSVQAPVRSVRCADSIWEAALRRAESEGVTMSYVMHSIIEGYGKGLVDLPHITVTYQKFPAKP